MDRKQWIETAAGALGRVSSRQCGQWLCVLALSAILSACGGGGGSDDSRADSTPSVTPTVIPTSSPSPSLEPEPAAENQQLVGSIVKSDIAGATIRAFDNEGRLLATVMSDDNGDFSLELPASYRGIVLLVSEGGRYIDEATGQLIEAAPSLRALIDLSHDQGAAPRLILSPLTTIVAQLAQPEAEQSAAGVAAEQLVVLYQTVATAFGLAGVDLARTRPRNLLSEAFSAGSPEADYGLVLAMLSQLSTAQPDASPGERISSLLGQLAEDIAADGHVDQFLTAIIAALRQLEEPPNPGGLGLASGAVDELLAAIQAAVQNVAPSPSPSADPSPSLSPTPTAAPVTPPPFVGGGGAPPPAPVPNPDIDGDGIPNDQDPDRDGDGISDIFEKQANTDISDPNSRPDDLDADGIPDAFDDDRDGDGTANDADEFPDDDNEIADLDLDGIGDNADEDRDGDGVPDDIDLFPDDASEQTDLDGDGVGDNADPDRDGDDVPNDEDFFPDDPSAFKVPTVRILSPASLSTVGASPVLVTGTIDDPDAALTLNGVPVTPTKADGMFQANVALEQGSNTIVARAVDALSNAGVATVSISLDMTPPIVTIAAPTNGQTVFQDRIDVSGVVNDIVRGTISDTEATVFVNNVQATVANRGYLATGVPLNVGSNVIEVQASDAVGNVGTARVTVNYTPQTDQVIEIASGQGQRGTILSNLAEDLVVRYTENGQPVSGQEIQFRVIQGDGKLRPGTDLEGQGASARTNADGLASMSFKLGSHAGPAAHRVRATAVGLAAEVVFQATANFGPGNKVNVISGNNQRVGVRQPLPQPLVVAVTDAGANLIPNANVEFRATRGGGRFTNGEQSIVVSTDNDGRASVVFTAGPEAGLDGQRVRALLQGTAASAGFTISALVPGDPGQTSISGIVLDNQDRALPGVTVRVDGVARQAVTDENGQFRIDSAPVGPVHLIVEGGTAQVPGEYPALSYNIVTVPGVDNPLAQPVYLVALDVDNAVQVGSQTVDVNTPLIPGFNLKVFANSATFPDGTRSGPVSITRVNANKVPMPPPNGMQPQLIVTIQPTGTRFDPPAPMTIPNVDGHPPGAEIEMFSYDHDLEEFVTIGLGTVSADGQSITSNPGSGVVKAGWHSVSVPDPNGCVADCGFCFDCDDDCKCVQVGSRVKQEQKPDDCKTLLCSGFQPADESGALKPDPPGNCKNRACVDGKPTTVADDSDVPRGVCRSCIAGSPVNSTSGEPCGGNDPAKSCLVCEDGRCQPAGCRAQKGTNTTKLSAEEAITNPPFGFVGDLLKRAETAISQHPLFNLTISPVADITLTDGERCCQDCANPNLLGLPYVDIVGNFGVQATLQFTPPGIGRSRKIPQKRFLGFEIDGEYFFSLVGLQANVGINEAIVGTISDCPGEGCFGTGFSTTFARKIGPAIFVKFTSVFNPSGSGVALPLAAIEGSGSATIDIDTNFTHSGSIKRDAQVQCPINNCFQVDFSKLDASVDIQVKLVLLGTVHEFALPPIEEPIFEGIVLGDAQCQL